MMKGCGLVSSAGYITSTVALNVVEGDEKGTRGRKAEDLAL
jgi:hypothetical protein